MILGEKRITEAYFDEDSQTWVVLGSLTWEGELKDGCKEIVHGRDTYGSGGITSYFQAEPGVWYIVGIFYADYDDVFASGLIKVLQDDGWEWG